MIAEFSEQLVWQGGGGIDPNGERFAVDAFCHEVFGQFTAESERAHSCLQQAIVELDDRYAAVNPSEIDVADWNDNQGVFPSLIVQVWQRAMALMGDHNQV